MASAKLITHEVVMNTPWTMLSFIQEMSLENRRLKAEVEALQAKLNQNSRNSNKPPSSDSPFTPKAKKPNYATPHKKRNGVRPQCLRPTTVTELRPGPCKCGCTDLIDPEPYYTHQHIEIPEPRLNVEHIILYRGRCSQCGRIAAPPTPPKSSAALPDALRQRNAADIRGFRGK